MEKIAKEGSTMDTIWIECPHCKEKMQVPRERESVICMFCGKTVPVSEILKENKEENGRILDVEKCLENLNFVLTGVDRIFHNYKNMVQNFKKDSYLKLFETYKEENYAYYTALKICLMNLLAEDEDSVFLKIAHSMIVCQQKNLEEVTKKTEKYGIQMDKNMFMAIFVLPAIKEIHMDKSDRLANRIAEEWSSNFKDSNIAASDFDAIMKGFHKKLCYITTAVCQNMHKGPECEELQLIRNFRDTYLIRSEHGRELIDEYYDIAPTLVKKIERSKSSVEIYNCLWTEYLKPCVEYIKIGKNEACEEIYCDMVNTLRAKYMEEHHE